MKFVPSHSVSISTAVHISSHIENTSWPSVQTKHSKPGRRIAKKRPRWALIQRSTPRWFVSLNWKFNPAVGAISPWTVFFKAFNEGEKRRISKWRPVQWGKCPCSSVAALCVNVKLLYIFPSAHRKWSGSTPPPQAFRQYNLCPIRRHHCHHCNFWGGFCSQSKERLSNLDIFNVRFLSYLSS